MTKYYCCFKCKEVVSYAVDEDSGDTTLDRGEFLAHNEYLVTGFEVKQEAEDYLKNDPHKMSPK